MAGPVTWLKQDELRSLDEWLKTASSDVPPAIITVITRMLAAYAHLSNVKTKTNQAVARLREAMGITPKSEASSRAIPLTDRQKLARLRAQRKGVDKSIKKYEERLGITRKKRSKPAKDPIVEDPGGDDFDLPGENLFNGSLAAIEQTEVKKKVERTDHFGEGSLGLHSSVSPPRRRMQVDMSVTEFSYLVETVTDPQTGKTVTASMDDVGPPGYEVTWEGIANLIMMAGVYAVPINRIEKMLKAASSYFSSARITELIIFGAEILEPIYTSSGESLSECGTLSGDDTPTRVLEIEKKLQEQDEVGVRTPRSALVRKIASCFGRISNIKDGSRPQKRYNVSVITGKTNPKDNRSYIYFFHSHLGHLGNLLTQLLSMRKPSNKKIVIQGDLSSNNLPDRKIASKFDVQIAGCMAHVRRPFFRNRLDDPVLCFTMLRAFLILSDIEDRIDELGRTKKTILRYRQRYSLRIWRIIYDIAQATVDGDPIYGEYWPKNTPLRTACQYIVGNFDALTLYCQDARLDLTNNLRERLLRWDKIMLDAAKFRKSERGRAAINIIRTLLHTASAAKVHPKNYLLWAFQNFRDIEAHPEKYTPYAYALHLDKEASSSVQNSNEN